MTEETGVRESDAGSRPGSPAAANPHEAMLVRRRRTAIVAAVLSSVLTVGLLLLVLLPGIGTAGSAEAADGKRPVSIGNPTAATIVPGADWEVTGAGSDELLLVSPDRGLTVRISPAPNGKPAEVLAGELGAGPGAAGSGAGSAAGDGKVRSETLASKLGIAHVDTSSRVSAVVGDGRRGVLLGAVLSESDAVHAKRDLAAYRPALVALVESIRLG